MNIVPEIRFLMFEQMNRVPSPVLKGSLMNRPRILMIVTGHAQLGATGKPTGIWAEELAAPYFALRDAGTQITLATPNGGTAPLDPGSVKAPGQNSPVVERLLADAELQQQLQATPAVAALNSSDFDALFFPGGHGTMWDLPQSQAVTHAVEHMLGAQRPVAAVCHGPAGLVNAKRPDGKPWVAGLRVNAFTDAEEAAVGLTEVVPFALETRLRELGAHFESAAPWQAHAVRDGALITGQNPQSSEKVAALLLDALGLKVALKAA
jgi:putative intracellular protease/amidase